MNEYKLEFYKTDKNENMKSDCHSQQQRKPLTKDKASLNLFIFLEKYWEEHIFGGLS